MAEIQRRCHHHGRLMVNDYGDMSMKKERSTVMSKISWKTSHIDVSDDIRASLTDKAHAVYIPLGASIVGSALCKVDPSATFISVAEIMDGKTMFDRGQMMEYSQQWLATHIPSLYSDVYIAHITQESIDKILHKVDAEAIVVTED